MKILFVSSGNFSGGINPIVENQANSLKSVGLNITTYGIKGKGLKGYLKNISLLKKELKCNNYNIIHAHYGSSAIVALLAKRKEKLIVSFMGDDILGTKNDNGKNTLISILESKFHKFLARYFYNYSIVKSEEMNSALRIKNCEVIPNGVDIDKFTSIDMIEAQKKLKLELNNKYILFAADPKRPEKNINLAKKAISLLEKKNVKLLVVFNIENDLIPYYLNASSVVILTSFHEGSPNIIKEAMACKRPIVTTDVGDVKKIIGNTKGCYVVKFDPIDVGTGISNALNFANENGHTKGTERIKELEIDSTKIAKRIESVYLKVLK